MHSSFGKCNSEWSVYVVAANIDVFDHHSVVICLGRGADLHMAQLMPLPLTLSCFSKIQIGAGTIIDFPNLGSTYNGGWCTATETDETLITRPSREVNVK